MVRCGDMGLLSREFLSQKSSWLRTNDVVVIGVLKRKEEKSQENKTRDCTSERSQQIWKVQGRALYQKSKLPSH